MGESRRLGRTTVPLIFFSIDTNLRMGVKITDVAALLSIGIVADLC